jgi:hypothetical protein
MAGAAHVIKSNFQESKNGLVGVVGSEIPLQQD